MQSTIIALFVTKEVAVGIMIVHPIKYGEDTEMENRYILINTENIEVGNIIEKLNGNNLVSWCNG